MCIDEAVGNEQSDGWFKPLTYDGGRAYRDDATAPEVAIPRFEGRARFRLFTGTR